MKLLRKSAVCLKHTHTDPHHNFLTNHNAPCEALARVRAGYDVCLCAAYVKVHWLSCEMCWAPVRGVLLGLQPLQCWAWLTSALHSDAFIVCFWWNWSWETHSRAFVCVCVCVCVCQRSEDSLWTFGLCFGFGSVAEVSCLCSWCVCVSSQNAVCQSVGGGRTTGFWCLLNMIQLSNQCCVISTVPRIHTHTHTHTLFRQFYFMKLKNNLKYKRRFHFILRCHFYSVFACAFY